MTSQASKFDTLSISAIGARTPTKLCQAGKVALRVLVRNVGAGIVFISGAVEDVNPQSGPSTGTYRLPAGQEDVFVVTPNSSLFALAVGIGGQLSVGTSEALPMEFLKS
jgi:hypothetical protein